MQAYREYKSFGRLVWTGIVSDRGASIRSRSCSSVSLDMGGVTGDAHCGLVRSACVRVEQLYDEGVENYILD